MKVLAATMLCLFTAAVASAETTPAPVVQPPAVLQVCPYCIELSEIVWFTDVQFLAPAGDDNAREKRNRKRMLEQSFRPVSNFQIATAQPPTATNPNLISGIVRRHHVCKGITIKFVETVPLGFGTSTGITDNTGDFLLAVCDGKLVDLDDYALEAVNSLRLAYKSDVDRIDAAISPANIQSIVAALVGRTKLDESVIVEKAAQRTVAILKRAN